LNDVAAIRRQLHVHASGLPAQVTPLIGREREVDEARCRLAHGETRLLTFTGPAGIGKTRLALALATALTAVEDGEPRICPDGAFFVDLAPLSDPGLVESSIAQALQLSGSSGPTTLTRVVAALQRRRVLLILDNFEQILPAAPRVAELLARCPELTIVVTSRAPLHLYGEHEFAVLPLGVPPDASGAGQPSPEQALAYPAVQLFVQRARAVSRLFDLTEKNAAAVARLCARLDGLPLAIELAATRSKLLSPATILERLNDGVFQTAINAHNRPARHHTLETAIDWSYRLLSLEEQRLFRRLGICVGGFSAATAAAISSGDAIAHSTDSHAGIDPLLASLVDKSLVQATPREDGEVRFSMLETIRAYALRQLTAHGEFDAVAARHAAYYTDLAEQATRIKPRQSLWLTRLDLEHDNLRAALRWSLAQEQVETASRLVISLWWYWRRRGYLDEGRAWMESVLALPSPPERGDDTPEPGTLRAGVLNAAGAIAMYQSDYPAAVTWLDEALARSRDLEDRAGVASALMFLGLVALRQNHLATARKQFERAIAIRRSLGDRWGTAMALTAFAGVPLQAGDYEEARTLELESAALFREVGDRWSLTMPLLGLGLQAFYQGEYDTARAYLDEVLVIQREVGDTWYTAATLYSLGEVARSSGDVERALALYRESLTTPRALGNSKAVAQCLASIGAVAHQAGQRRRAALMLGAAQALFEEATVALAPIEQAQLERDLSDARAAMGDQAFQIAHSAGRALPVSEAVRKALDFTLDTSVATPSANGSTPAILTRREREVATLVARGMTNRQIAQALTITEGTAGSHIEHILAKLGFQSRTQVAAWAVAHKLLDAAV
jgi:predicted ATPase/DNA-binding NarL/FixJ family response regulator/Tfp pilus assembly protein PilF